ncbi:MAG: aminotransferase class I/II-fold pyridoxal phosphate-dependent enzyme [Lachnospiraceae bacterium]|nr:aminotransferase class I/II-fold pyridoxal phosphate-dependent enzyme [Lachnospiraceae bacterium]
MENKVPTGQLHNRKRLVDMLREYATSKAYPFHMPGHKRNTDVEELSDFAAAFSLDITEIDGFDELYHPEGILKKAQENAAAFYGAKQSFFCVNGSTGALHTALAAAWDGRKPLLIARNCHKAVFNGICIQAKDTIQVDYLIPEWIEDAGIQGCISPEEVEDKLKRKSYGAVVLTSPTYDGILSDIREIATIVHKYEIPLIVDEAHGAYFGIGKDIPESAVSCGADLVIQSMHKTLPALTQTALLHVNGERIDPERVREKLEMYQTSSPSYLFMANMDACIQYVRENGRQLAENYVRMEQYVKDEAKKLQNIRVFTEPGKILLSVKGTDKNGSWLQEQLVKKYDLQPEMASETYVLMMLTVMDRMEGIERLMQALSELDAICRKEITDPEESQPLYRTQADLPKVKMSMADAMEQEAEALHLEEGEGQTAARFVYLYPPGAPILVPGEVISKKEIHLLQRAVLKGLHVQGLEEENKKIRVVAR